MLVKNLTKSELLVQFLVIGVLIVPGSTIKCYICDSSRNPGCADLKANSAIEPEVCTPEKINRMDTWLTELNKISYFNHNAGSPEHNVPMQCQKVVASKEDGNPVVARFCQITTGETDPCTIPMGKVKEDRSVKIEFCGVCDTDMCNGVQQKTATISSVIAISIILIFKNFL